MALLDDLTKHPDTLTLDIADVDVHFLLSQEAYAKAKDEGIDLAALDQVDEDDPAESLRALSTLVYIGNLPFGQAESMEEVEALMTPRIAAQVGPQIMAQFDDLADEVADDAVGN